MRERREISALFPPAVAAVAAMLRKFFSSSAARGRGEKKIVVENIEQLDLLGWYNWGGLGV